MRSAIRAASQLSGRGPLTWMLPLYLHVNQKSDYDMMMMMIRLHHNLFITVPQIISNDYTITSLYHYCWGQSINRVSYTLCYIQTKMYRLYRKMTIFYKIYTFLGSIFEPFCIQNRVITNRVIKRLMCTIFDLITALCTQVFQKN